MTPGVRPGRHHTQGFALVYAQLARLRHARIPVVISDA